MPGADFIANLVLNTGINTNWRLTGQGDMFNRLQTMPCAVPWMAAFLYYRG